MRRLLPIVLLMLLASCSPPSFVSHRFNNFTAYYNTFYNAQKAFEDGVQALEASDAPIDRTRYLPVFVPPDRVTNTQNFERAIQKSADVLRDHPNSKWVDDALMLIGKSYFYQQNYVGAAQKFKEAITLGSGLEGEARFWMARALIAAGEYTAAADHLIESLGGEATYGRWTDMMYLVRGELHVRQGAWNDAAAALGRGLEGDPDDEAAARAAFLLGQVRETAGAYNAAARAFEYVNEAYQPRYELAYAAHVSAIRVRGLYGDTAAALQRLRRMERDDKNYDKWAELTLLRAELYRVHGQPAAARRMLQTLLYGEEAPRGAVRGQAHYTLGIIHQHAYDDFSRAAAYYDTAATALGRNTSSSDDEMGMAPPAITDGQARADLFGNLAARSEAASRMDSLLYLGSLDDEAFQQFVASLRQRQTAQRTQRQQAEAERRDEQRFSGEQPFIERNGNDTEPDRTTENAGSNFLFHQDRVRAQEARRSFERRWGRRPLVPNWRRLEAVTARSEGQQAVRGGELTPDGEPGGMAQDSLAAAGVDVSDVPRDSTSRAQMRARRAVARYELANALFLAAHRPDSAATWYERVIEEDAEEPVARRALYALAEVRQAQGDTTQARTLYQQVVEQYPGSAFARQAQQRLGDAVASVEADAYTRARAAYEDAYDAWQRGDADEALEQFVDVAVQYEQTRAAPKALWAAAMLFRQQRPDQRLAPDTPLPVAFNRVLAPADSVAELRASRTDRVTARWTQSTLRDLIAFIYEQYPESPQAQRAERLLAAMDAMTTAATDSVVADSVAADSAVATESAFADSVAAREADVDTTAIAEQRTSDAFRADSTRADSVRVDSSAAGAGAVAFEEGVWGIVVASRPGQNAADAVRDTFAERFRNAGLPVEVYETVVDRETWYRVAIGRFESESAATAAMQDVADQLPEGAWVFRVP